MCWFYIILAIQLKVAGTISMKYAESFPKFIPSVWVCYGGTFPLLALALKKIPINIAYQQLIFITMKKNKYSQTLTATAILIFVTSWALSQFPADFVGDPSFRKFLPKFEQGVTNFINGDATLW